MSNPTTKPTAEACPNKFQDGTTVDRATERQIANVRRQAFEEAAGTAQAIDRLQQWLNEDRRGRRWEIHSDICVGFQVDLREYDNAEYKLLTRSRQPTLPQAVSSALAVLALAQEQPK